MAAAFCKCMWWHQRCHYCLGNTISDSKLYCKGCRPAFPSKQTCMLLSRKDLKSHISSVEGRVSLVAYLLMCRHVVQPIQATIHLLKLFCLPLLSSSSPLVLQEQQNTRRQSLFAIRNITNGGKQGCRIWSQCLQQSILASLMLLSWGRCVSHKYRHCCLCMGMTV